MDKGVDSMTDIMTNQTCVIQQQYDTDSFYTLIGYVISIGEDQNCSPAIRDIPYADSQFLDDGTYILEPRSFQISLRLSDREKEMMDTIYEYHEYAYDPSAQLYPYTEIYLIRTDKAKSWHYKVFINNKEENWEYAMENGRKVRWWNVTLQCNAKDFEYAEPLVSIMSFPFSVHGHLVIDGVVTYFPYSNQLLSAGPHTILYVPDSTYSFDHWVKYWGIIIDKGHETDNPVTIHVVGLGAMIAYYNGP